MKIINFILLLLFYSCNCLDQLVKLEINKTIDGNSGDYFYFKVEQENEFIQIKYLQSAKYFPCMKAYESDNEAEITKSPPTREDDHTNQFKYYYYDGSVYTYFYFPKTDKIKIICFGFFRQSYIYNLSFKRGQLFLVHESQHIELNDVF